MLSVNKKKWDVNLRYALWDDRISVKISIRTSPFQLVYEKEEDLPIQLELLVLKLIQNETDSNDLVKRMYELIEVQQEREQVSLKLLVHQKKRNNNPYKKAIERDFYLGDLVLKWDAKRENKGKHGNFYNIWMGPYLISFVKDNNTFILVE